MLSKINIEKLPSYQIGIEQGLEQGIEKGIEREALKIVLNGIKKVSMTKSSVLLHP